MLSAFCLNVNSKSIDVNEAGVLGLELAPFEPCSSLTGACVEL